MGSFRIIMFIGLTFLVGILSLITVLFRSAITDVVNILIGNNMLSTDTVNTVNTILGVSQWAGVICLIALALWAVSAAINDKKEGEV